MIWAVIEFGTGVGTADRDGAEALLAAHQLGSLSGHEVGCLAVGRGATDASEGSEAALRARLAAHGIRVGALARLTGWQDLDTDPLVDWLESEIAGHDPAVWIFPGSAEWRTAAARLAVRLGWPVVGEVIEFAEPGQAAGDAAQGEGGQGSSISVVRPVFGGSVLAVETLTLPCLVVVRPRAFAGGPPSDAACDVAAVELGHKAAPPSEVPPESAGRVTVVSVEYQQSDLPAIGDADVVVAGGRGLGDQEGFQLLTELARALGGCVGASRAAVDAGWAPYEAQVGQSGRTVAPRLYLAVGVSGAAQHLAGMRGARVVVAINRNPDAPVFGTCNYGLQGDWRELVQALLDELGSDGGGGRN